MSLYILQDTQNRFLDKEKNWVYSCPADQLFRARHRDEALNLLIELNAKDVSLRAQVVACEADDKGRPRLSADAKLYSNNSDTVSEDANLNEDERVDDVEQADAETAVA